MALLPRFGYYGLVKVYRVVAAAVSAGVLLLSVPPVASAATGGATLKGPSTGWVGETSVYTWSASRAATGVSYPKGARLTNLGGSCTKSRCGGKFAITFDTPGGAPIRVKFAGGKSVSKLVNVEDPNAPLITIPVVPEISNLGVDWQADMLAAVNKLRRSKGLAALKQCTALDNAAQRYAKVMADTGHFDHTGPDGRSPWDRFQAEGYVYTSARENIAYGQKNVDDVMTAWIDSPGHYLNLVAEDVADIGVGAYRNAEGVIYWAQAFGSGKGC